MEERVTKPSEQRRNLEIDTDDLKPSFKNYRNPQDDKVQLALQEAARRLGAQGKPLVLPPGDNEAEETSDCSANSTSSATKEKSAPNSTTPSAAKRRLTPQELADLEGRIYVETMQKRLDKMKRGEKVREI
jgi:hypothetical protein